MLGFRGISDIIFCYIEVTRVSGGSVVWDFTLHTAAYRISMGNSNTVSVNNNKVIRL
jgi:hypothetical protein